MADGTVESRNCSNSIILLITVVLKKHAPFGKFLSKVSRCECVNGQGTSNPVVLHLFSIMRRTKQTDENTYTRFAVPQKRVTNILPQLGDARMEADFPTR
jgi:hypothetical protein